jgi:hypothetical protein
MPSNEPDIFWIQSALECLGSAATRRGLEVQLLFFHFFIFHFVPLLHSISDQ